jgi:coenzyme F420-reducing hydrogenase delta subunit
MAEPVTPDVVVYVCRNSLPNGGHLPRQWKRDGFHVLVREVPCSGKIDLQYLFHALEAGVHGICVVACPEGECHLVQGNYRAELRLRALQRLVAEIGLEPERLVLLHSSSDASAEDIQGQIEGAVRRFHALGESPVSHANRVAARE